MLEVNRIYCVDALQAIRDIDDDSIDLVITDPPYGDNVGYGRMNKEIENNETPLLNCQMLWELQRVLKNDRTIYNFTNWKHYPFLTEFIIRYTCFKVKQMIVCNKSHWGMGYSFRNKHELILVLEKGNPVYNFKDIPNVIDFDMLTHDENTHPHQKPEEIIRKLIQHSSNPGDLILDPFFGSGSTCIACKQCNRKYIGFEIDKNYYEQAQKRLAQNTLFGQIQLNQQKEV